MKLPLKYIALLVMAALLAIFAYQAYWLVGLYGTMQAKMRTDIGEALRISDYGEMMYRVEKLRKRKHDQHGRIELSANYNVHTGTTSGTSEVVVKDEKNTEAKRTLAKLMRQHKPAAIHFNTDTKETKVLPADSSDAALTTNDNFSTILKDQQNMQELALYMQRGLHSGLDAMSEPDVKYVDRLLTRRLAELGIKGQHRLYYLHKYKTAGSKGMLTDTVAAEGHLPGGRTERYSYETDLVDSYSYLLLLPPTTTVVLRQMAGILGASLVTLAVLVLVFWYLIRTILRQKTLDEMKSDFTNNMTHELKTPIAVAYAANDALLNFDTSITAEKQKEYLRISQQQLEKLGGLVEQILSMSMERRHTLQLNMEHVAVEPLITPLMAQYRLQAHKKAELSLSVEPPGATVWADRQHLQHIVGNLIDNAIKYSGAEVAIRIACSPGRIVVSDNGIGISPERLPYVFDKFYRVPRGDRHEVKGYGLGLYYVKSLMEKMGGQITAASTPGRGTTFTLLFGQ